MALTNKEIELIKGIQDRLKHGDINDIVSVTGLGRATVSRALNVSSEIFNEKVYDAALSIIEKREKRISNKLEKLGS